MIFTGRCIDENGVPIPDVTVSILQGGVFGYHYSSKSNEGGFFRFDDLIDLPIAALRVNKKGFRDRFIYLPISPYTPLNRSSPALPWKSGTRNTQFIISANLGELLDISPGIAK